MKKKGKLLIVSAPSGSGKSTIIGKMREKYENLYFSVSATSRPPRGTEQNGVGYYFLTPDEFRQKIENDEFVEYEEVYPGKFYGTLKSEVENKLNEGKNVVFDVDVHGGMNIKKQYGKKALSLYIQPPSIAELRRRLEKRGTDSQEIIEQRIQRAEYELSFIDKFDKVVVNDVLDVAVEEALAIVTEFFEK